MKKNLFVLAILFVLFTLCEYKSFSQAQTKKQSCFSDRQIDLDAKNLPPNYHGNDLISLANEYVRRENLTKDEFETSAQFRERVESEKKKPLLAELNSNSTFAFEISDTKFQYDADKQLMYAELNLTSNLVWKSPCNTDQSILSFFRDSITIPMSFSLEIAKAKKTKPNIKTLLIRSRLELQEIWLYDVVTGEIFFKQKFDLKKIREDAKKQEEDIKRQEENTKQQELEKRRRQISNAKTFYENGKDDEALAELRKSLSIEPMNSEAYFLRGKIHFRRGDLEQSVSSLKTALFWDNKITEAHIMLGKIYLQRGDCLQAKNYLASALAIDSDNQEAIELEKQVQRCNR